VEGHEIGREQEPGLKGFEQNVMGRRTGVRPSRACEFWQKTGGSAFSAQQSTPGFGAQRLGSKTIGRRVNERVRHIFFLPSAASTERQDESRCGTWMRGALSEQHLYGPHTCSDIFF
jgi:hypothetical protein